MTSDFVFPLDELPWQQIAPGLREKSQTSGKVRFRIVEFSSSFVEPDWCVKAHAGYVLEGGIVVDVDGQRVRFRKGEALHLPPGIRHRHLETLETAVLFLVETTDG